MNALIGILTPNMNAKELVGNQLKTKETNTKDSFAKTIDKAQSNVGESLNEDNIVSQGKPDKTKQTYKKVESIIKEELQNQQEEQISVDENVIALMMNLLENQLNLTPDEITNLLEKQGITLMDLSDQEQFRDFMMMALGKDEMALLNGEVDLKALSKLYEQVKTLQSVYYTENQVITEETLVSQGEVIQDTQVIADINPNQEASVLSNGIPPEILKGEGTLNELNDRATSIKTVKMDTKVGEEVEGVFKTSELSMTLPIQGLSKGIKMEFWQNNLTATTLNPQIDIKMPIHNQVLEKIYYAKLESLKELEMQLAPKELGKLTFKMIEQNGVVTAHIKVEQDKTKDLILEHLAELQEGLEKQGLMIQDVQVEVKKDAHQSQMEKEKQKSAKRIQEIIAKHMDEILEEDQMNEVVSKSLTSIELDYEA